MVARYFTYLIKLFFPILCKGCDTPLSNHFNLFCAKCADKLPFTGWFFFKKNNLMDKLSLYIDIESANSLLFFSKKNITQKILHDLKYNNQQKIGTILGQVALDKWYDELLLMSVDTVIPIASHSKKKKIRGYNQVEPFAKVIANGLNASIITTAMKRIKQQSQITRNRNDRFEGMKNTFRLIDGQELTGKHVLVIDDLVTTGATLIAFCKALQTVKDIKISVATIGFAG